jgi:NADH-quinone oxidoreductase subunit L
MPITFWRVDPQTAALCGVPFFSGFFSKDEIIEGAKHNHYTVFFIIGLIGAFMTTAYMTRATYLTFFGTARGGAAGHHHDEHGEEHELETDGSFGHAVASSHGHDTHDTHDAHDTHAAAHGHDDHGSGHHPKGFIFATESPLLLVGPIMILGFLA